MMSAVQALALLAFPALALWGVQRARPLAWLGPVVLCYLFGALLANVPGVPLVPSVSLGVGGARVALAIPLLLFSTDVRKWLRQARATVLSFVLACFAACASAAAVGLSFAADRADAWQVAGMLVGVYTGG